MRHEPSLAPRRAASSSRSASAAKAAITSPVCESTAASLDLASASCSFSAERCESYRRDGADAGVLFVSPFSQAPAVAPARKVTTKLSIVNVFIIGKKRSGEEKVPPVMVRFRGDIALPEPRTHKPSSAPVPRATLVRELVVGVRHT
jgi:hypothetical protein